MPTTPPRQRTLQDADLKERLQHLRRVDDWRNIWAVVRTYLFLLIVIGGAIAFDVWRSANGLPWYVDLPVFAVAVLCIGAGQHQLTALGHEASHHVLLRNRMANEMVSDWFCMFPLLTTTHHYRLQHLAHHQFVNDPERDPNFSQLQVNGHWVDFPMTSARFWKALFCEAMPWNLFNYLRATAKHNALGGTHSPYQKHAGPRSAIARKAGVYYMVGLAALLGYLTVRGDAMMIVAASSAVLIAALLFFFFIPDGWFSQHRVHSTVSIRWLSIERVIHMTVVFATIAWLAVVVHPRVITYSVVLWIVPMVTSFSLFMMLRQLVQHSNGDRGWLTNTRVFLMNVLVRESVLPFGQDYHLPHHLYASVPHYNLKKLHEVLMEYPEYRDNALIVENAVLPMPGHEYPTMVEMLGPDYAPAARRAAHVDNTVLDGFEVEEQDEILKEARESAIS